MHLSDTLFEMLSALRFDYGDDLARIAVHHASQGPQPEIGDYFDYEPGRGLISYLPANRLDADAMEAVTFPFRFKTPGRQTMRVGRAIKAMLAGLADPTDTAVETFAHLLRARDTALLGEFVLVEGEAIRHWYHASNYAYDQYTLNTSCMRYDNCQPYLDIYVHNPQAIKLLTMQHRETGKLLARALVWITPQGTVMDRVYGTNLTMAAFANYAREHGWYEATDYEDRFRHNGATVIRTFTLPLVSWKFPTYPYMDTMTCLDFEEGIITNVGVAVPRRWRVVFNSTDGDRHSGLGRLACCPSCDTFLLPDEPCPSCVHCATCGELRRQDEYCQSCVECVACGVMVGPATRVWSGRAWFCADHRAEADADDQQHAAAKALARQQSLRRSWNRPYVPYSFASTYYPYHSTNNTATTFNSGQWQHFASWCEDQR